MISLDCAINLEVGEDSSCMHSMSLLFASQLHCRIEEPFPESGVSAFGILQQNSGKVRLTCRGGSSRHPSSVYRLQSAHRCLERCEDTSEIKDHTILSCPLRLSQTAIAPTISMAASDVAGFLYL